MAAKKGVVKAQQKQPTRPNFVTGADAFICVKILLLVLAIGTFGYFLRNYRQTTCTKVGEGRGQNDQQETDMYSGNKRAP